MDPSALEGVSKHLESSLDFWGALLLGATCLVVVGLVLEYRHDIAEFIEQARRPAAVFTWKRFWELVGAILVTVGVAGELFFTYKASRVESSLRDNNHQIEASLKQHVSQAELKQKEIEQDNITLRIALERLRRSTGKRYLSPDEQDELVNALSKYVITDVVIEFEQGKTEAEGFGEDFAFVFKRLHWYPRHWPGVNGTHGTDPITGRPILFFPPGITIRVASLSNPPPAAQALKSALGKLDFPFSSTIGQAWDVAPGRKNLFTYLEVVIGDR